MSKKKKAALEPRFRFPEFRERGNWEIGTLGDIANKVTERNQNNSINRVLTNSAVNGVIDQSDYFYREVANKNNLDNYFVVNEGDYVYNPRISATAPVGPVSKNKIGEGVMSPLYTIIRFESHNNDFYEHYFRTNLWHRYLRNVSNTGARNDRLSISNDDFMNIPIALPSLDEQQKIADCLASLDELINAGEKKLALLKTHKKGLMQKLFPAEGKTTPEVRFKGYTEAWRQRKFNNVFDYSISNNTFSRSELNYEGGKVKNIHYGDILTKFGSCVDVQHESIPFITNGNVDDYKNRLLQDGDIVFADTAEDEITGKAIEIANIQDSKIVAGLHTMAYRPRIKISSYFSGYYFNSQSYRKQLLPLMQGIKVLSLNKSSLSKTETFIPISPDEQAAIGNFFKNLDKQITAQTKKIEALKIHKKGLMQGLFPSIEEAGG